MPARSTQYDLIVTSYRDDPTARAALLEQTAESVRRAQKIYSLAYRRWEELTLSSASRVLRVRDRVVVGLGEASILEVGLTLHGTYGVPVIRGSALKGLAAHYCASICGAEEPRFKLSGDDYLVLFGDTGDSGYLIFHDAWILPEDVNRGVVKDVMTPHHQAYYSSGGQTPPTDFDDPNPVTFLAVAGRFRFAVECQDDGATGQACAQLGLDLLSQALQTWGVGGKTNAGYGRFEETNR